MAHITRRLVGAMVLVTVAGVVAPPLRVGNAAGEALIATQTGSCSGIDASTSGWNWTKPTFEISQDGTSFSSAANSGYALAVCRDSQRYWFQVFKADGTKELGSAALAVTFRVTLPAKSGDTLTYASGYSNMVSYSGANNTAVVVTKPATVSKINFDSFANFKSRHPECATVTMETWNTCSIQKADEDFTATVIQHVAYSTSASLSTMEQTTVGLWIGANVNGYKIQMSCGSPGASGQAVRTPSGSGDSITIAGKTYTKIPGTETFRGPDGLTYTPAQLQAMMQSSGGSGGSGGYPSGGTGSSGGSYELKVSMEGTPHLRADGVTLNKGSMKAFLPASIAKKCFGNSDGTSTLAEIADKLTMTRSEAGAADSTPAFTVQAQSTPVEGLLVVVAEMTFSNPDYTLKSLLRAAAAGSGTTTAPASGTTSSSSGGTAKISIKGSKATITVTMAKAGTLKFYRKVGTKTTLVKTLKAKAGANKVVLSHAKGAVYTVRSSTGKVVATLK